MFFHIATGTLAAQTSAFRRQTIRSIVMKQRNTWSKSLPAVMAVLCLGQPAAFADDGIADRWTTQDRIEGVWLAKVTLTNCVTGEALPFPGANFDAMGLFGANGSFHNTDANDPALRSGIFGYWERTGRHTYRFAFRLFRFDTGGLLIGSQIVRHNLVLARDGLSYSSSGTAEFYDVNGIPSMPNGCSRTTATRFR
jgi:hypothetical protein